MSRTLVFWTPRGDRKVISREFTSERHLENFIAYVERKFTYMLDEVFENN